MKKKMNFLRVMMALAVIAIVPAEKAMAFDCGCYAVATANLKDGYGTIKVTGSYKVVKKEIAKLESAGLVTSQEAASSIGSISVTLLDAITKEEAAILDLRCHSTATIHVVGGGTVTLEGSCREVRREIKRYRDVGLLVEAPSRQQPSREDASDS